MDMLTTKNMARRICLLCFKLSLSRERAWAPVPSNGVLHKCFDTKKRDSAADYPIGTLKGYAEALQGLGASLFSVQDLPTV